MSARYRGSYETRPVIAGLPRTNVNTPGFQLSMGAFLLGAGLLMFWGDAPPPGEWTAGMIRSWRAGAWAGAIAGGVLLFCAAQGLARARARSLAKAAGSPDAWTLDYDWTPGVCRDRAVAEALEAALWIVLSAGLGAAGLIVSAWGPGDGTLAIRVAATLLVGLSALCIALSFGTLRRGLVFGNSILRWEGGGPLRAGTRWTGVIEVAERVAAPHAHLQHVKERRHQDSESVHYSRHEHDRVDAAVLLERGPGGRKVLRVSALIPAGAPSTELSRDPARYWELRVADDASGWSTSFLVPVYP